MAGPGKPTEVLLFAHRGGMAHGPENSLPAFARALKLGATGLESDVWLSADGVPVLDHDGRARSGWRRRPLAELARGQLPARIPSLGELYDRCGTRFELALDVCDANAAGAVLAVARSRGEGVARRLWLCSGDPERLARWRDLDRDVHLVHSSASFRPRPDELDGALARLSGLGIDALNLPWRRCRADTVRVAHAHGLAVFAWGLRSAEQAELAARMGLDAIMGDDVRRLRAGLAAPRG